MSTRITLFTVPRPFLREFSYIQENAIRSWLFLDPTPQVILLGDEPGVAETARKLNVESISNVKKMNGDLPLIGDVFRKSQKASVNEVVVYINSDIILTKSFLSAVTVVEKRFQNFLMLGRRWDFGGVKDKFNFLPGWEEKLIELVKREGSLHPPTGIDYQVFRKGNWMDQPPFVAGRLAWDNWFTVQALRASHPVIDATEAVIVIHQTHDYSLCAGGIKEARNGRYAEHNRKLAGNSIFGGFITNATWTLSSDFVLKERSES